MRDSFDAVHECGLPVIAAVGAPAIGAGLAMAACCDQIGYRTEQDYTTRIRRFADSDEVRIANREKRLPDFRWE